MSTLSPLRRWFVVVYGALRRSYESSPTSHETSSKWLLGARRIAGNMSSQLQKASAQSPEAWQDQRPFIFGYVDAMADMHVTKNGKRPQGPESRELSAHVLQILLGDAWEGREMWLFNVWALQTRPEFASGRKAALEDYAKWGDQAMTSIFDRLVANTRAGTDRVNEKTG